MALILFITIDVLIKKFATNIYNKNYDLIAIGKYIFLMALLSEIDLSLLTIEGNL